MKASVRFLLARDKKLFFEKENLGKANNKKKIQPTRKSKIEKRTLKRQRFPK
jgi:hypothetical protein